LDFVTYTKLTAVIGRQIKVGAVGVPLFDVGGSDGCVVICRQILYMKFIFTCQCEVEDEAEVEPQDEK
jgi:hypothetical protein